MFLDLTAKYYGVQALGFLCSLKVETILTWYP